MNSIINISLEYSLSQFEEDIINRIMNEELTLKEKTNVIMNLDADSKKIILRKIGFKKEFINSI